ncbi:MAG: polysaccharide biosynthesis/export family protein [Pirellulales bacterium]|nr:polysaccharide biosynthesis/export family protein [Pirellulales bacterium]
MIPSSEEIALLLLRTTMALGTAGLLVGALVWRLRPASLAAQRAAWLLVLAQGVAWFHLPISVARPAWLRPSVVESVERTDEDNPLPVAAFAAEIESAPSINAESLEGNPVAAPAVGWATWLVRVWLGGLAIALGLGASAYVRFLARCAGSRAAELAWRDEWTELLTRQGVRRSIPLRVGNRIGPALCLTPAGYRLLVPAGLWSRLLPDQRTAILRHELAHFRRGDVWKNLTAHLLALPHWFNPLAWWAARRFVELAEWACDREAAAGDPAGRIGYAKALVDVGAMSAPFLPCAATAGGSSLAVRVRQLLTVPSLEDTTMKKAVLIVVAVMLVALGVFRVRLVADEPVPENPVAGPTVGIESSTGEEAATTPLPERHRPLYVIEPPDVLQIELRDLLPKLPQRMSAFDILTLRITGTNILPREYLVDRDGAFDFGPGFGTVDVAGKTLDEFKAAVTERFRDVLDDPSVSVELARSTRFPPISGHYLVGPDGTVNLRQYGVVHVAGKTIAEAAQTLEKHLGATLYDPRVTVEVTAFNSKVYYVLSKGAAGRGDNVIRVPWTGSDTVLDAIAQASNRESIAGKYIWILRPTPGREVVLPVDLEALARDATTAANIELLPGDRVIISDSPRDAKPIAREPRTSLDAMYGRPAATAPRVAAPVGRERGTSPVVRPSSPEHSGPGATSDRHGSSEAIRDRLGLELEDISPEQFRERFKTRYRGGLAIASVRPDSPAAKQGIRRGDVLVGLGAWETVSLESLRYILGRPELDEDDSLKFFILRGDETLFGHLSL